MFFFPFAFSSAFYFGSGEAAGKGWEGESNGPVGMVGMGLNQSVQPPRDTIWRELEERAAAVGQKHQEKQSAASIQVTLYNLAQLRHHWI